MSQTYFKGIFHSDSYVEPMFISFLSGKRIPKYEKEIWEGNRSTMLKTKLTSFCYFQSSNKSLFWEIIILFVLQFPHTFSVLNSFIQIYQHLAKNMWVTLNMLTFFWTLDGIKSVYFKPISLKKMSFDWTR